MKDYIFQNFLSMDGRINRKTYFLRGCIIFIPAFILNKYINPYLVIRGDSTETMKVLLCIGLQLLIVIQQIKRFHDFNKGRIIIMFPILVVLFRGLYYYTSEEDMIILSNVISLVLQVIFLVNKSSTTINKYGDIPN